MTADAKTPEGFSLKRWSRVKRETARAAQAPAATVVPANATVVPANATVVPATAAVVPANAGTQRLSTNATGSAPPATPTPTPAAALPPIDSLTIDSDFTAFLQPKVDEAVKRQALKKLFGDPRFNVMDGLDVYIDDYSKPDPIAPEIARQLVQARHILNPPRTRINDQGFVEDVPPEKIAAETPADAPQALPEARPPAPPADGAVAASPAPEVREEPASPAPEMHKEPEAPAANKPAGAGPSEPAPQ